MSHGFRIFLEILKHLLLLARKLLHALNQSLIELFLRHLNFIFADIRDKSEIHRHMEGVHI
ncbi:MAG: hypothetical protein VXW20_03520, partial [Pseudomonadota bacterium]|nr:hypothetical protein [Pseudomonadota bacterium]